MAADRAAWPATAWTLTAPESYVLLHGPHASGRETFKLALLDLIARGALRLVEVTGRGVFGRGRRTSVLVPGPTPVPPAAQPLASVWLVYSGVPLRSYAGGVTGVPVADLARAAVRRYRSLDRYRFEEVVSALVDRRLFAREEYRVLWLFPAQRIVVTPAGTRARADLERRLTLGGEQFGGWVERDPARAVAFAGLAGAAVLLMSPLYPDFQRLHRQLGSGAASAGDAGSGGAAAGLPGADRPEDQAGGVSAFGGLDLSTIQIEGVDLGSLTFDFDLSALDILNDAVSAIDAGVDSGGDGGDGGGGGGDGE
jgi:hypothetical protein